MAEGAQTVYGVVKGEPVGVPAPITASEVFRKKSGRFVTNNAGYMELADDGDTLLAGWMDYGGDNTSVDGDVGLWYPAPLNLHVVFRIPVNAGTYVVAMLGKTCDLARGTQFGVTSTQGAKLDASGEDNLLIVGGDLVGNLFVDVVFNPSKLTGYSGVV